MTAADAGLPPVPPPDRLRDLLGDVDVYWLDQMLRGRVAPEAEVLDAGCGGGRNVEYLLRAGQTVFAVDRDPAAVQAVRALAARVSPAPPPADRFAVAELDALPFADGSFDVVLCVAVLHFARDDAHFRGMVDELWRVLRPGGMLFARLSSSACLREGAVRLEGNRWRVPDGTERYLVDLPTLLRETERLGGRRLDPVKTVDVQGMRCMTNWVLGKEG